MPLASSRIASQKRAEEVEKERIEKERRERVVNGPKHKRKDSLSLPRTAQSTTRVTRDTAKRRRNAREASEERMKKQVKEGPLKESESVKENVDVVMGSPPRAKKEPFSDELLMSSPTPYWKVVQERRASKKFSPPLTRSAKKSSAPNNGVALAFSPPDQEKNAIREKEEVEAKLDDRGRRICDAIDEGRYLEFSPNSFACRNRNFDERQEEARKQQKIASMKQDDDEEVDEPEQPLDCSRDDARNTSDSQVSEMSASASASHQADPEMKADIKTIKEQLDLVVNDRRASNAGLMLQQQALQTTLQTNRSELEAARAKTEKLETAKANLEGTVTTLQTKLAKSKDDFEAEKNRLTADLESCKSDLTSKVEGLEGDVATLQKEKVQLMKEIESLEAELKETKAFLSTNEADSKLVEQQMAQIETLKGVEKEHFKTTEELKNMVAIREQLEAEIKRIESELSECKKNSADADVQLKDALAQLKQNEIDSQKEIQARDTTISDLMERINGLREEKNGSSGELSAMKEEMSKLQSVKEAQDKEISDLQAALEKAQQKFKQTRDTFSKEKDSVEASLKNLKNALESSSTSLRVAQQNEAKKAKECEQKNDRILELERQLSEYKGRLTDATGRLSTSDEREEELFRKLQQSDRIRAELHNRVTQLCGNIRVFVRVRPTIPGEEEKLESLEKAKSKTRRGTKALPTNENPFNFPGQLDFDGGSQASDDITKRVIEIKEPAKDRGGLSERRKVWRFPFDNVFSPTSGQEDVWEGVAPLVQSAIDGFPVCIFAYGQTGSGKTHTMLGEPGNEGVICRAVNKMFAAKRELVEFSRGTTEVDMSVELLEIYNEQVRDLLAPNAGPNGREVSLKVTSNEVVGNIRVPAGSEDEVMRVLALAQSRRCVKATESNAESSRSHMVFTLHFNVEMQNGIKRSGRLNICDLAGSERLGKSGANAVVKGDLMKETKCINTSLSVLSNVIEKLQNGSSSIPFRESKLTFLLQNSLGGNSKTLAIVCCNPHPAHFHESLCSIRFAEKVNKVELKAMANFSC